MSMTQAQFTDFFDSTALPFANSLMKRQYNLLPVTWPLIFNRISSTREIEQKRATIGYGPYALINGEFGVPAQDQMYQDYNTTFRHSKYGKHTLVSANLSADDNGRILMDRVPQMVLSEVDTMNLLAWNVLNNAFTTNGYDGVPLCSASHPSRRPGVAAQSNTLATPANLSHDTLQVMQTQFFLQRDSSGKNIMVNNSYLVVHPNQMHIALEITKSSMRSDTANNAENAMKYFPNGGIPQVIATPYLTSQTVSFLIAAQGQNGLVWFDRQKPYSTAFTDNWTEAGVIIRRFRCSQGYFEFRGVLGNNA